jgi:membrane dipeptidase
VRLSDEQLDAVVRRELQELSGRWHAPERDTAASRADMSAETIRDRGTSRRPLAAAALVAVATAALGLALARPLLPALRSSDAGRTPADGGRVRPAGDFPLGLTGGTLVWDASSDSALLLVAGAQTWSWSANRGWAELHPDVAPAPRIQGAMTYDPADGTVLLFGGLYGTTARNDTWLWEDTQWQQLVPATSPPPGPALMCWDPSVAAPLLVADVNAKGGGNTWRWTGESWQATGPAPAGALRMAWDPAAGAVVLVSRTSAGGSAATWEWRDDRWTRAGDAPPLAAEVGEDSTAQMAYDRTTGEMLLVGPTAAPRIQTWSWTPAGGWTSRGAIADQWAAGMAASPTGVLLFAGPNSEGAFAHRLCPATTRGARHWRISPRGGGYTHPITMIVDSHLDIAWNALAEGRDFLEPTRGYLVSRRALADAGVGLVFATVFTAPRRSRLMGKTPYGYDTAREAYLLGRAQLSYYRSVGLQLIRTRDELRAYVRDWRPGQLAAVLLMENADPIETPRQVGEWADHGVRLVGPAWTRTRYCGGTHAPGGLTDEGRDLLTSMRRRGVVLDLSHMADRTLRDSMETWRGALVASHVGARSLNPRQRQLPDDVIAEVGRRKGVLGVSMYAGHLRHDGRRAGVADVVAHAKHFAEVAGDPAFVGIGSDLDGGFGVQQAAIRSLDGLKELRTALRRVFGAADVEGIMGGNWLRFLDSALPAGRAATAA